MSKLRLASSFVLLAALSTGCRSVNKNMNDHWSASSIPGRSNEYFTGYDGQRHEGFGNYMGGNFNDMGLFFRRHFWNSNPANPFQASPVRPFQGPGNPNGDSEFSVSEKYDEKNSAE